MLLFTIRFGRLLLMMGRHSRAESLFYYFRLEDQVPENHSLRLIDRHIKFQFIRAKLKDAYSDAGKPSIDPELLLRMLLVGYLYGVTSEKTGGRATHASGVASVAARDMIERYRQRYGYLPQTLAADTTYGNGELLQWLDDRGIAAYVRVKENPNGPTDLYGIDQFTYRPEENCYICPEGKILKYVGINARNRTHVYSTVKRCRECSQKSRRTRGKYRTIAIHAPNIDDGLAGEDARKKLERETGIEPATNGLGSRYSTIELLPLVILQGAPVRRKRSGTAHQPCATL